MHRVCATCGQVNRVPTKHLADTGRCGACKGTLSPMAEPLDADPATFDDITTNARVPVLVDFWAAWCGPCRMVAPAVQRVARDMAGKALVLKVDTERHPQLAARFNIRGIPNFLIFSKGHPVHQQAGAVDHTVLRRWIEQAA